MELNAELFRTRGRAALPVEAAIVRELDDADMVLLSTERGTKPSNIKRLTERHHNLARNLASGMTVSDAAVLCGYTTSRVSILQGDPAFKELLDFYREDAARPYRDLHIRLSGIAADAADLLAEKLEADSELEVEERKVSVGQLVELTKMGADRTGFGPQSSTLNVNVDMAGRLEEARKRVARRKLEVIQGGLIEGEVIRD
jgi:hypothetical protein